MGRIRKSIFVLITVQILKMEDSLQYHHEATEAMRMMLNRPEMLPDIPDKEGRTPLWHALDSMRKEHAAFSLKPEIQDSGRFDGFLRETIELLCVRDDVDPHQSSGLTKTPVELATELTETRKRGIRQKSVVHVDSSPGGIESSLPGDVDPSPTGDANADGRAKLRVMTKALKPMIRQAGTLNKLAPPHLRPPQHLRRPLRIGERIKQPTHLRSSVNPMEMVV